MESMSGGGHDEKVEGGSHESDQTNDGAAANIEGTDKPESGEMAVVAKAPEGTEESSGPKGYAALGVLEKGVKASVNAVPGERRSIWGCE